MPPQRKSRSPSLFSIPPEDKLGKPDLLTLVFSMDTTGLEPVTPTMST
ncbi:hypothetical protein OSCI_3410004 [Kamptonema sp. PCC 6506]|nr:hypothetical protein OSCI_3410004 [Kamptonema sp. PCC 6506]